MALFLEKFTPLAKILHGIDKFHLWLRHADFYRSAGQENKNSTWYSKSEDFKIRKRKRKWTRAQNKNVPQTSKI